MLRVLELQSVAGISILPNEVSALFKLHYLGLRETGIQQLPNNIQMLQSLQTLDLHNSNIRKLPRGVTQLKQLRHLIVPIRFAFAPIISWQWKNLQTLKEVISNEKLVHRLGDMKDLRALGLVVEQAHFPQLCTSLTKMRNLRSLSLSLYASKEQLNFEMLNSPPPPLQKLALEGRFFEGKMPTFICSCAELTRMRLWNSQLIEDPLPSLG